jgi:hypothetical protein
VIFPCKLQTAKRIKKTRPRWTGWILHRIPGQVPVGSVGRPHNCPRDRPSLARDARERRAGVGRSSPRLAGKKKSAPPSERHPGKHCGAGLA